MEGNTEDLNSSGASDATGGFDLASAGDTISADLFGNSIEPTGSGDGDPNLDDGGDTSNTAGTGHPAASGTTPSEGSQPPQQPATEAPKTWRPEAAAKFATLPPEVQQEVLKREEDMFRGLEGYKADANVGKAVNQILQPYMPMLQQAGLNPLQQVEGLMQAHYLLATGTPEQKQMLFQRLAQDYGVNLGYEQPYIDPQVQALQKQLSDLQSKLSGREQQEAAAARSQLQSQIDTFASDPAHPYFDEVANDIAGLLRSGAAKDLADAYEKAVWANPVTRAKEQGRLTAEADAKAKAEAATKATQARKATGANVSAKAKAASAAAPTGSIDDTLNAALTAIRSRA